MWVLFFLILVTSLSATASVGLQLLVEPDNVQVKRGFFGQMACQFTEPVTSCYWEKDGRVIDIQERYQLVSDPWDKGDCSIQITNASFELDDGQWQCGVPLTSNRSGIISKAANLTVLIPPKEPILYKDGKPIVNKSLLSIEDPWNAPNIQCKSEGGNPAAELEFRVRNDKVHDLYQVTREEVSPDSKTELATVKLLTNYSDGIPLSWDKQVLACVSRHPYDNFAYHTAVAYLDINVTSMHLVSEPQDLKVKRGLTGILRCTFSSSTPDCYWTKDNQLISIGSRYRYLDTPEISGNCAIIITDSQPDMDSGIWRCGTHETSRHKGIMSAPAYYFVLVEPHKPVITFNGKRMTDGEDLYIERHQLAPTFVCESAHGQPEADLSWRIGNTSVGGHLSVYNDTLGGKYPTRTAILNLMQHFNASWLGMTLDCVADHPTYNEEFAVGLHLLQHTSIVNVTGSIHVALEQQDPHPHPPREHSDHSGRLFVNSSSVVHLHCLADGHPAPRHFMWERRDDTGGPWQSFDNGQHISFAAKSGQFTCVTWNSHHGELKVRSSVYEVVVIDEDDSDSLTYVTSTTIAVIGIILIVAVVAGLYVRCHRHRIRSRAAMNSGADQERYLHEDNVYDREPMKNEGTVDQTYEEICYVEPRSTKIPNHHSSADHVYQEISAK